MDGRTEREIRDKFKNSKNRLVLLDYDGTLVKHTSQAGTASLPEDMSEIIYRLAADPHTETYIITGRSQTDIDLFLNHIPIDIIAEHGAMMKKKGIWKNQITDSFSWKGTIIPLLNQITAICPESYIEEKNFSLTWHYRNADPVLGYSCSRKLIRLLEEVIHSYNLKILDGNKVVEILTNAVGKGYAVKKLLDQNHYDFVLSIGDDATDEEMFSFFSSDSDAVTIKVGEGITKARYKLYNIMEVEDFLKHLSE
jgi:trehalose 6-phosphate synthase/phosphatase